MSNKHIAMEGTGINGMATACLLRQSRHHVTVYAADFFPAFTSAKAAAFCFPYHIRNDNRGIAWCRLSYEYDKEFAKTVQPASA